MLLLGACYCTHFSKTKPQTSLDDSSIWDVKAQSFIEFSELVNKIKGYDHILIGEVHDNPIHHERQAKIINSLGAQIKSVIFEQLVDSQDAVLNKYNKSAKKDYSKLEQELKWQATGWPAWKIYEPVFDASYSSGATVIHGLFSKNKLMDIYRQGLKDSFNKNEILYDEAMTYPNDKKSTQLDVIFESHCKLMPRESLTRMLDIQIARDAYMAKRLLTNKKPSVLISGNGHVRKDVGVPHFLRDTKVVSIIQEEYEESAPSSPGKESRLTADFVWYSKPHPREDQCLKLKKFINKGKKHK